MSRRRIVPSRPAPASPGVVVQPLGDPAGAGGVRLSERRLGILRHIEEMGGAITCLPVEIGSAVEAAGLVVDGLLVRHEGSNGAAGAPLGMRQAPARAPAQSALSAWLRSRSSSAGATAGGPACVPHWELTTAGRALLLRLRTV